MFELKYTFPFSKHENDTKKHQSKFQKEPPQLWRHNQSPTHIKAALSLFQLFHQELWRHNHMTQVVDASLECWWHSKAAWKFFWQQKKNTQQRSSFLLQFFFSAFRAEWRTKRSFQLLSFFVGFCNLWRVNFEKHTCWTLK